MGLLLFGHKPRTEAAKVLYLSVIIFGNAFTSNAFIANSNWSVVRQVMNSCEDAVYFLSWMASQDGNNSSKFQISEYASIILYSLSTKSIPGVWGGLRKPTVNYVDFYRGKVISVRIRGTELEC